MKNWIDNTNNNSSTCMLLKHINSPPRDWGGGGGLQRERESERERDIYI